MAGAGYKLFNTGDVLTAAQVNTYLQEQVVMVFANAAARTTALSGVLAEGMVTYLKDTDALEIYSGSAWVGYGSGDITGITTGATSGLTGGVTSGTADLKLNTTAKGGLLVGTGSGTSTELAVGSNNTVLTADSSTASGLKWAAASTGALVRITGASFSAVSSVSLPNSTFTSTYKNYLLIFNIDSSSGASTAYLRMRASGSDDTNSNYYGGQYQVSYSGSPSAARQTGAQNTGELFPNGQPGVINLLIANPQVSGRTMIQVDSVDGNSITRSIGVMEFLGSTQFDALTIYLTSGNMTGRYDVYGLTNS